MLPNSGNHGLNPTDKTNSRASTSQDLRSQISSGNDGRKKRHQDNPIYSVREARARRKGCSVGKTDSNNSKTEVQNTDGSFDNWACASKERQDVSASSHKSEVCAAHGMRATFHGFIYQITWLVKLLRYALDKGKNFCLQSEEPGFGLFDDAVLEIEKEDGRKSTILVQFKHSLLDSTKIDCDSLFLDKNSKFYLPKYCASSIIAGYEQNLGGANVSGTHILCTNIRLDLGNDASNDPVEVSRKKSPTVTLRSQWGDKIQLKQVGDTYGLFNNGGATYSFGRKSNILKLVRDRCIEELEKKIETLENKSEKLTKSRLLKNKLRSLIDKGELDESIRKFFDGFVLAVSQPKGVELETITVNELSKEFNLGNGDVIYNQFKEKISAWIKKRRTYI